MPKKRYTAEEIIHKLREAEDKLILEEVAEKNSKPSAAAAGQGSESRTENARVRFPEQPVSEQPRVGLCRLLG